MAMTTKRALDGLTYEIVGAAIEVHKLLGPGLLESVYQKCLRQEFMIRRLRFVSQMDIPVEYKGLELRTELRCDFLVENSIVVELKAVETLAPVFEAQLLTYMKLLEIPKGILINFFCTNLFREGQKTFVNEYFRNLPD
jgi:GxxExxY protein